MIQWEKEEIDFLKQNYTKMTRRELSDKLNRSIASIGWKVEDLGIQKFPSWTQEEINILKDNYIDKTTKELAVLLKRTKSGVQTKLNQLELNRPDKYTYDTSYFENINTEEKAYWLGFIYADGYVSESRRGKEFGIELQIGDISHLKKFNKSISGNIKVSTRARDRSNSNFIKANKTESCSLRLYREKIIDDLISWGVTPNKTYENKSIPPIPHSLVRHFIRGYFDGDGCVRSYKQKNLTYFACDFCGINKTMLDSIRLELYSNGINSHFNVEPFKKGATRECYRLVIRDIKSVYIFLSWIYDDSSIWLDRKMMRYKMYVKDFRLKERALKK